MTTSGKRTRLVRPYPIHTLEYALEIASTIQEAGSGLPFDRAMLAEAMGTTPASSGFTLRLNSSAKYGLTEGGYSDTAITLTPLGQRVVAPRDPVDGHQALLEAAMEPAVFAKFYHRLNGKHLPEEAFAKNMLQHDSHIDARLVDECLSIIMANGLFAGIIEEKGGALTVKAPVFAPKRGPIEYTSESIGYGPPSETVDDPTDFEPPETGTGRQGEDCRPPLREKTVIAERAASTPPNYQVYISHSGQDAAVEAVCGVLAAFEMPYILGTPGEGVSGLDAHLMMRQCRSAIFVTGGEEGDETSNLIFQLGAASMLFERRIVVCQIAVGAAPSMPSSVRVVTFDSEDQGDWGLRLLRALQVAGAIQIAVA
jgi:hypothetical protein